MIADPRNRSTWIWAAARNVPAPGLGDHPADDRRDARGPGPRRRAASRSGSGPRGSRACAIPRTNASAASQPPGLAASAGPMPAVPCVEEQRPDLGRREPADGAGHDRQRHREPATSASPRRGPSVRAATRPATAASSSSATPVTGGVQRERLEEPREDGDPRGLGDQREGEREARARDGSALVRSAGIGWSPSRSLSRSSGDHQALGRAPVGVEDAPAGPRTRAAGRSRRRAPHVDRRPPRRPRRRSAPGGGAPGRTRAGREPSGRAPWSRAGRSSRRPRGAARTASRRGPDRRASRSSTRSAWPGADDTATLAIRVSAPV